MAVACKLFRGRVPPTLGHINQALIYRENAKTFPDTFNAKITRSIQS